MPVVDLYLTSIVISVVPYLILTLIFFSKMSTYRLGPVNSKSFIAHFLL